MFTQHVEEKLRMFSDKKYQVLAKNTSAEIKEKSESGKVILQCSVQNDALVFDTPEKNVLPYLDGDKRGARACADTFVFSQVEGEDSCNLHIMEFKKTINTSSLDKAKWQLTMGLYNARALAGFLGIPIRDVFFYSAYRRDEITDMEESTLIQLRASNNREAIQKMNDWKIGRCKLEIDGEVRCFPQKKIKLDESGHGAICLS